MPPDLNVPVREQTDVASARRECVDLARQSGLNAHEVGVVGIVATEAATNLIKHGGGGDIIARKLRENRRAIEIIAADRGKGMIDPAACFLDGFSTAGSPGTGLGAIARLSFFHQIYSLPGGGTVLAAHVGQPAGERDALEFAGISLPYPGESVCGDAWDLQTSVDQCRLTVADGLGHGVFASEAANAAVATVTDSRAPEHPVLLAMMHEKLRSSRGAAVAVVNIDYSNAAVSFTGVGNIAGCVVEASVPRRQMISMTGIVGHEIRKIQTYRYPLLAESIVVLHTDGLTDRWSLERYPGLFSCGVSVIAAVLLRDFRRTRDDATVVVVRQSRVDA